MILDKHTLTRFLSEFTGTAMLMTLGCMGCIGAGGELYPRKLVEIGVSFGMVVGICVQCFACVSGAHINPTVTVTNCLLGHMPADIAGVYLVVQLLGAMFGYALLLPLVSKEEYERGNGLCITVVHPLYKKWQGVGIEFVLTSTLTFFCCAVWDKRNATHGDTVSVRFAVLIATLVFAGGFQTGASMNLSRTLAPAIIQNHYEDLWVYVVSHFFAATIIPISWLYLYTPREVRTSQ